jgi:hypothetical protein
VRVKVTYTMDHQEVAGLIHDITSACRRKLSSHAEFRFDLRDLNRTTRDLNSLFDDLDTVRDQLRDCLNMALGLEQALEPDEEPRPLEEPEIEVKPSGD